VGIVDAVLNHVYILNPKYVVFGGKISEHKYFNLKVFKNLMLKTCRQPPINSVNDVKLIKAKLGNDAALYGVASLAINRDYKIERIKESKK
jgi:predicted NBD/HSP70 family sugar kinase